MSFLVVSPAAPPPPPSSLEPCRLSRRALRTTLLPCRRCGTGYLFFAFSVIGSYFVKYGETLLPFVNDGESFAVPIVATLMILSASGFNCWKWWTRSNEEAKGVTDFGGLI